MSYAVAVRALCEFTARAGDLDLRFTPAPTGLEGMAGHAAVTARRGPAYETEVALSGQHEGLLVRGRADGYDPVANQLEEIKTYRGRLDSVRDNHRAVHWAQARVYGHLLCQARGLDSLRVALVYFNVVTEEETVLVETHEAPALAAFFRAQCARFLAWAAAELEHRQARDAALEQLAFPHGEFRAGQRDLAVAAYRTARDGGCLMAQAPTGIGKTLGTIFPLLKASPGAGLDKIFFLAAKSPGRGLALEALETVNAQPAAPGLRVLDLQARDKTCVHPDLACHGESCPLAQGFYDRLPQAREAALAHARLDAATVAAAAREHQVCPYYLSQELIRWSDVVVGDYNYYYDATAMLYAMTQAYQWKVAVLVDEAHNLVDRARRMYTGELDQASLAAARYAAPKALNKSLDGLQRSWNALNKKQAERYQAYDDVAAGVLAAVQKAVGAIMDHMAESPLPQDDPVLAFYFEALQFMRLAEQFGSHALFDVTLSDASAAGAKTRPSVLCVRNVIPAPYLAARYAAAHATVLFSGTLSPQQFYRDTLGLPAATPWLDVAAPFQAEQLAVRVVGNVSTRYRDRERSLAPIVELIARQYEERPGNYLGFLSSFDYLRQVADLMRERHPSVPIWLQTPGMDEAGRAAFLARFTEAGQGVGFAVLGGAFSEGVDLPGRRLIGAFIATLGLPQVNPVNENMKRAMDQRYGVDKGYDYTYLYPGMQKVVQAAGRVIRTEHDVGTVHLIDDRYRRAKVRGLLPGWWRVE
ncbi:ATP-dependent DNA helicase [Achromobacter insolitus]|uniref:ATP-dependent DNA helicase n=1 Tax=Achromobacter insolitus TaxID=217204 RepID=UPI0007C726D4|nr:ATP-dependent DNA helicase [Achromobacter insolitus]OAE51626.1 ATP-dependent DNA helicase [Achromobacter insolitus]OCZ50299.1 ATP-dependent DNA helicase [Achromobacter insolitus]